MVGPKKHSEAVKYVRADRISTADAAKQPESENVCVIEEAAVTIGVDVGWLVCKESCYKGSKDVSLTLPVVAEADASKPANEIVFRVARKALPAPMGPT